MAGTTSAMNIAQWNGEDWFALGDGLSDEGKSLYLDGSTLYVGGLFQDSGNVNSKRIATFTCIEPSATK